jgi:hypothetical protein
LGEICAIMPLAKGFGFLNRSLGGKLKERSPQTTFNCGGPRSAWGRFPGPRVAAAYLGIRGAVPIRKTR